MVHFNWVTKLITSGFDTAIVDAITIDNTGDVYIGGYIITPTVIYQGTTTGDPNTPIAAINSANSFVLVKFDKNGQYLWYQQGDNIGIYQAGNSISYDNDAIYVITTTINDVIQPTSTLTNFYNTPGAAAGIFVSNPTTPVDYSTYSPNLKGFLIKYDTSGKLLWYTAIGSNNNLYSTYTVSAKDNIVFVSGSGKNIINFYDTNGTNPPSNISVSMKSIPIPRVIRIYSQIYT